MIRVTLIAADMLKQIFCFGATVVVIPTPLEDGVVAVFTLPDVVAPLFTVTPEDCVTAVFTLPPVECVIVVFTVPPVDCVTAVFTVPLVDEATVVL